MLTGLSTVAAVTIGVPLGILGFRRAGLRSVLLPLVGVLQTIPSLAMLALLLVAFGRIGTVPALVALTLYALLPIVRNTIVGLEGMDPDVGEAARGLGMTPRQELLRVRLPLALPVLAAGVRTAAVIGVGIATLSAFIGAGGLGQFINRGLALSDTGLILLGAVPAALLALVVDGSIAGLEWAADPRRHRRRSTARVALRRVAWAFPALLLAAPPLALLAGGGGESAGRSDAGGRVAICTKNFTEQLLLGELMAQTIERHTSLAVERRFNMGGTVICHEALASGAVDLYAEYTGTALTSILRDAGTFPGGDPDRVLAHVDARYRTRFDATWLPPFGFDNTFVLVARPELAEALAGPGASALADRAGALTVGMTAEFAERPDGYRGFTERYGFSFGAARDLDPGLLYDAVARGEVDVAFGFATDGRIEAYDLAVLEDDRGFFPPYEAAPVVRLDALRAHSALGPALERLAGALPDSVMRRLNSQADAGQASVPEIARHFLDARVDRR